MKKVLLSLLSIGMLSLNGCNKGNTSVLPSQKNGSPSSTKLSHENGGQNPDSGPILKGTDTGGGGSPRDIQKILVENMREHLYSEIVRITTGTDAPTPRLKSAAQNLLVSYPYYNDLQPETVKILQEMATNDGWKDIRETEIVIKERCIDMYGQERSATTPMNQMRADICLNPDAIIDDLGYAIPDSALIALILHEYAHHYGYEDKDYAFAVDIALAIEVSNEDAIRDGRNPNDLIQPKP